ncbi:MAG TPA: hypothetical protein VNM14_24615 [Planctomycetota bacterium]|jgi:hypothetical protein|nr:hypothetical protein [Planctomycetota bacterium]
MKTLLAFAIWALLPLQQGENPDYGYWSSYKSGSWAKLKGEISDRGVKALMEVNVTLLELTADKAVIESKIKMTFNGKVQPEETEKEEILKNKAKYSIKILKEGDEEIEVAGKKLQCHWIEGTKEKDKIKYWLAKEVPGAIVKAEISGGDSTSVVTMSVVAWEKK